MSTQTTLRSWLLVTITTVAACACSNDPAKGLEESYHLGEKIAKEREGAFEKEKGLIEAVKFEPKKLMQVSFGSSPSVKARCEILFRVKEQDWGIVPDVAYDCEDVKARASALDGAQATLKKRLAMPIDDLQAKLDVRDWPAATMGSMGPSVVKAKTLGLTFDLEACVKTTAEHLAESAAELSRLKCEIFLKPGLRVKEFRSRLEEARVPALAATTQGGTLVAPSPEEILTCPAAEPTSGTIAFPGAGTGETNGKAVAYKISLRQGEKIQIDLGSPQFDAYLELWSAGCAKRLDQNDDGGGGRDARIVFSPKVAGDFIVVATAANRRPPRGTYVLRTSSDQKSLSEEQKKQLQEFADWVGKATEDEVADAWRESAGDDLQLACLNRHRFGIDQVVRHVVTTGALKQCSDGLHTATEARLETLRAKAASEGK